MQSIGNEDDGFWQVATSCEVEAKRIARAPLCASQRGLRPAVVSDRKRGTIRILDAKLSREVCPAPPAPPAVHSDFTAPSFSKTTPSEPMHINTCMAILLVSCDDDQEQAAKSEIWTGWASGHVAVYALAQSGPVGRGPHTKCDPVITMYAHRGAVHLLSSSHRRFVFSASYDCNILQFDITSRRVIRSIPSACRARGEFPTSMLRSMACSLRGLCVRRDAGHEGFTTVHDALYLSMDNRSHYVVAVGGNDDQNDVAMQLLTSSRASCKVALSVDPPASGAAASGGSILCLGDEDGAVFFLPLMVSATETHVPAASPNCHSVTNGQFLVYLANLYNTIRGGAGGASSGQYEVCLHKGPIVDAALISSSAGVDGSVSHRLIFASGKQTITGCHVVVAAHGGITLCALSFSLTAASPISHIAPPYDLTPGSKNYGSSGDGIYYLCGVDGTATVLVAAPRFCGEGPQASAGGAVSRDASGAHPNSQQRLREVVDMVQRTKLMAIAADAALEKQQQVSNQLQEEQRVLQEQCTRLAAALAVKTAELAEQGATRSSFDALKTSLQSKVTILEDDNALLRLELQRAGEHVALLRKRLEAADDAQANANARIDDYIKQLQRRDDDLKNILREKDSAGQNLAERVGENKILASNVMNLERKLAKQEEEIRGYEQRRQRDQRLIDDQQMIIEELRGKTLHAQSEASTLRGKLTDAELSLQLAKAKQQSVRDILVKQGILDPQQLNQQSARQRQNVAASSGGAPQITDAFNLESLLASSVRPGAADQRRVSGVESPSVAPLSLIHIYPPTDLQQPTRAVNASLDAA